MKLNLTKIDASKKFLDKLKGVSDPEQKRKIIGNEFVYTFDEEVKKLAEGENIHWLAQGTLYTDVIESGTQTAQTIKSVYSVPWACLLYTSTADRQLLSLRSRRFSIPPSTF